MLRLMRFCWAPWLLLFFTLSSSVPVLCQTVTIRRAPTVAMPGLVDSNSPAFWRDGELFLINSDGSPYLSHAGSQYYLLEAGLQQVILETREHFPMWIESVFQDDDGTLYGWYHHEPGAVCPGSSLTAPEIGAVVSYDGGSTFNDLGIVLSSGDAPSCTAKNGFFAGGHGDFSVIPDRDRGYLYFLFGNYGGDVSGQGVAIARLAFADLQSPVGAIFKYYDGDWTEPGLGGRATPIFQATVAWQDAHTDSYWGPSVHWNTYLQSYVMLLNRSCCASGWPQEGIYISLNLDIADPNGWTAPARILGGTDIGYSPGWYPQVVGLGPDETDTVAGQVVRLYIKGISHWEMIFGPPEVFVPEPEEEEPTAR